MNRFIVLGIVLGAILTFLAVRGQTQEEFNNQWGSVEFYYEYCLDQLDSDDVDFLRSIADEHGLVYFRVFLDTNTIVFPVLINEVFGEVDKD